MIIYGMSRKKAPTPQLDFNIDDFLKMDSDGLNGLGLGIAEPEEMSRGSKSSRWFGNNRTADQPAETTESGGGSAQQPNEVEKKKQHDVSGHEDAARSLLEIMQKGSQPRFNDLQKFLTAEELEKGTGDWLFMLEKIIVN